VSWRIRIVGLVATTALGCGRGHAGAATSPPTADASVAIAAASPVTSAAPDASAALAPIPNDPLFAALPVAGFPDAVASLPNGATSARPVVVVLHGSGDRPDWNCDAWRHITGALPFILCPRGAPNLAWSTKDDRRFTHAGGATLRRHVDAALAALAAKWPGYVDIERPLVTGFSLGATEIAQLALKDPGRFPRVAVLEGGADVWTLRAARDYAAGGGKRVLFGCGSSWCPLGAKLAAARVEKGNVEARVVYADVGHTNDRPLQEAIMKEYAWFTDGDARFSPHDL
jgi:poly(3-hydroxybutyrate) depolymerase